MADSVEGDEFNRRLDRARRALLAGRASAFAYAAGVSEKDVARVGGATSTPPRLPDASADRGSDPR